MNLDSRYSAMSNETVSTRIQIYIWQLYSYAYYAPFLDVYKTSIEIQSISMIVILFCYGLLLRMSSIHAL